MCAIQVVVTMGIHACKYNSLLNTSLYNRQIIRRLIFCTKAIITDDDFIITDNGFCAEVELLEYLYIIFDS